MPKNVGGNPQLTGSKKEPLVKAKHGPLRRAGELLKAMPKNVGGKGFAKSVVTTTGPKKVPLVDEAPPASVVQKKYH
jgi:hypothetical protein